MRSLIAIVVALSSACASSPLAPPAPPAPKEPGPSAAEAFAPRLEMGVPSPHAMPDIFENWFIIDGFPALSDDGGVVVAARSLGDGARANPNLVVEAWAVADGQRIFQAVIVDPDDGDIDLAEDTPLAKATLQRTRAAFARARDFLAARRWQPLIELEVTQWDDYEQANVFSSRDGELVLSYVEPRLIVDHRHAARWLERPLPEWSAPMGPELCGPDQAEDGLFPPECFCHNPANGERAWVDAARRVLVADVRYAGHDTCWEPDNTMHVLPLPAGPGDGWTEMARDAALMHVAHDFLQLDLPDSEPDARDRENAERFLARWEQRFPTAPEVSAARRLIGR